MKLIRNVNLSQYRNLHPEGQKLISDWFKRAWDMRDCQSKDSFEPFIFAWIAFNGWAACITKLDYERGSSGWLDALMLNPNIPQSFTGLVEDSQSPVAIYAREFSKMWPIFKVQELRRIERERQIELLYEKGANRSEVVNRYLEAGAKEFQPGCWTRHRDAEENIPVVWPHILAALYRVRCNLFHAEKARESETDQRIVSPAFRVLVYFLNSLLVKY
jgi:hypothetical protein